MRLVIAFCLVLIVAIKSSTAQQLPHFSQYILNPFIYNPAALGNSGYKELNLVYRQQWLGIDDAPTTQAFNFQFPTKKNADFGVNFYNDKAVLLSSSSLTFGFAYRVNFSDQNFVKLGISSGIGINSFDLDKVDNPDDPAIHEVLNQTSFLSGQFGVFYSYHGLEVGFSLPQIYGFSALDTTNFQGFTIAPMDNYIFSTSYKFDLGTSELGMRPYLQYWKSSELPLVLELGTFLDYKDLLMIGGSYRKNYGGTGYIGINIKENISFSYAYEFAAGHQQKSIGNGSHEFSFKVRFGKKIGGNKKRHLAQEKVQNIQTSNSNHNQAWGNTAEKTEPDPEESTDNTDNALNQVQVAKEVDLQLKDISTAQAVSDSIHDIDVANSDPNFEMPKPAFQKGFYVVLGAFELYINAVDYLKQLESKGIKASYAYVYDRELYYVYNLYTTDVGEADRLRNQLTKHHAFKDAWVYDFK